MNDSPKLHTTSNSTLARLLLAAVLCMAWLVTAPSGSSSAVAQDATPAAGWDPSWPLSPEFIAEFEGDLPANLPRYSLDAELDPASQSLLGTLRLEYTNHTGIPQAELPFRLYPNADYYGEGATTITRLIVDDEVRQPKLSISDTVMTAPLGRLLPNGRQTTIQIEFETIVPVDSTGSFGIFSHDLDRETWVLADWYPILAGWDEESGWGLEPPTIWGDPTFSETAAYSLQLTVPAGFSVAATGSEITGAGDQGADTYEISTGPVREFAMAIDNGFTVLETESGGVRVRLHLDATAPITGAESFLETAAAAVQAFADRYGAYPYDELDIVQTELASALGVSWSGIVFMDAARLNSKLPQVQEPGSILLFTLVHEIGHQWWGALIGVNSNDHAFMNESMTNYLTIVAYDDVFGEQAARDVLQSMVVAPYLALLESAGDGQVDISIDQVVDMSAYSRLIYGKGALGLLAIRSEIGHQAFFDALGIYSSEFAFELAEPDDLIGAFEQTSDQSLDALWSFWFEEAGATSSDVDALLADVTNS